MSKRPGPIMSRAETAAYLHTTLDGLARIEDNDPQLIRAAGVRTTHMGRPTIRYRREALEAWLKGAAA